MGANTIRLSDLRAMSDEERKATLARVSAEANAPMNGQVAMIETKIRAYEERYEMSSDELIERLKSNEQRETAEIADWLFWLSVRARKRDGE
jgi:hypothetical protein